MIQLLTVLFMGWIALLQVPPAASATEERAMGVPRPFSKPVRVGEVDFEVAAERTWTRPAEVYGVFQPGIQLRVRNRTNKNLTLKLGDTLGVSFKTVNGPELVNAPISRRHMPDPVTIPAGRSSTITLPILLDHARSGNVCLGARSIYAAGTSWLTGDVPPGKYLLCLSLKGSRGSADAWLGKVRTAPLTVEVRASLRSPGVDLNKR